jgi:hypothetical protein
LDAFKIQLLDSLGHAQELGDAAFGELSRLFVEITIKVSDAFTREEVRQAVRTMGPIGLSEGAKRMKQLLAGSDTDAATLWRQRISPWIESFWPDTTEFLGPRPAAAANALPFHAREAFPKAAELLWRKHLQQESLAGEAWHRVVLPLLHEESLEQQDKEKWFGYATNFPQETLDRLARITTPNSPLPWDKADLAEFLARIRHRSPNVVNSASFVYLFATTH